MKTAKTYVGIQGNYYEKAQEGGHKSQKFMYRTREEFLLGLLSSNKFEKVLDIGFGSGNIMKKLYEKNFSRKLYGADISFRAAKHLKTEKNLKYGFRAVVSSAEALPFKENFFDLIILSHVVEHVKDPKKALNECKRVCRKKGEILIAFPNTMSYWPLAEAVFDKTLAQKDYSLQKQHIQHFSHFGFSKMLKKEGFEIKKSLTLYLLSLPLSVFSERLAKFFYGFDKKASFLPFGAISYFLVKKVK